MEVLAEGKRLEEKVSSTLIWYVLIGVITNSVMHVNPTEELLIP